MLNQNPIKATTVFLDFFENHTSDLYTTFCKTINFSKKIRKREEEKQK
jgi:hypothetical protein